MTEQGSQQIYSQVDQAPDPRALVEHMDKLGRLDPLQGVKRQNCDFLNLQPGMRVLDVGSGPGDDVHALARLVAPNGRAVGVDSSETMVAAARERSEGLDLPVEFHVMDATRLDFPDASFDRVRSDRVLQHVGDPEAVLAEMLRVTSSSGIIAVSDTDWGMMAVDMSNRELTRRLFTFGFDRGIRNPWIGRQLPRLIREAGLLDIRVAPHAIVLPPNTEPPGQIARLLKMAVDEGIASAEEAAAWMQERDERIATGTYFAAIVMFTVAGQKP